MTKHLRFLMLALLAIICTGGVKAAVGDTYKLVTSVDELKAGDVIVIGCKQLNKVMGTPKTNNYKSQTVDFTDNTFSFVEGITELTLGNVNGKWQFSPSEGTYLFASGQNKSGNNYLSTTKDNTLESSMATISFTTSNNSTITFGGTAKSKIIKCNNSDKENILFSCYTSSTKNTFVVQIYKRQDSGKTATTTTFGAGFDGKTFIFTDGVLEGFTAPTATWTPAGVGGSVAYSSSDKDIVTVDNGGKLKFTNTKFGTATITATFTPTEATKYKISSASYTVVNKEGERIATNIAFAEGIENSTITVKDGEAFEGYKATCTTEGAKGAIQYSSSNTDVATVDEATGAVTMGSKYGKTVITAQFIGTGGYANSDKISYTIEYKGDYAFYESFNTCAGTGGNGDKFNGTGTDKSEYDNNGWDGTSVSAANKCIKVGSGGKKGSIISPTISVSKDGLLTFKAAAWDARDEKLTIKVSVSSGELTYNNTSAKEQTITLDKGAWKDYEMTVSGTTSFRVTFAAATNESNRFFLDEVMVKEIAAADVTLDEDKDNVVEAAENANITLKRTLYADGGWNTLCLPFTLTDAQAKAAFGDDVELRTLESVSGNTLTFASATGITAGVPYLIKVSKVAGDNTYTFTGVTTIAVKDETDFGSSGKKDNVEFVGIYSPTDASVWSATNEYAVFLGTGNKFYKAKAGTTMKAFRAFFLVPASTDTQALRAVIDGTTTGIDDLNIDTVKADGRVYNLNGQCVGYSLEGLKAGIYIQNGKKVIKK